METQLLPISRPRPTATAVMDDHILDNPIWTSLVADHAKFALGDTHARRYDSDIGPLSAVPDISPASLDAMRKLVETTGPVFAAHRFDLPVPQGLRAVVDRRAFQMVFDAEAPSQDTDPRIVTLGHDDAAAMFDLADLTKPGPYGKRTHELGRYWGVKENGQLVAMAGERLRQGNYIEISAVCTHPDNRGQGLGRALSAYACRAILDSGKTPYLHVFQDNTGAIRLYESLGFHRRIELRGLLLERA